MDKSMVETFEYLQERAEKAARATDRLRQAHSLLENAIMEVAPIAGIEFTSKDPLPGVSAPHYEEPVPIYLAIRKTADLSGSVARGDWSLCLVCEGLYGNWGVMRSVEKASRGMMLAATRALPEFLTAYAAKVADTVDTCNGAANVLEALLSGIGKG